MFYTNVCRDQDTFVSHLIHRFYVDIMPPKQMEKFSIHFIFNYLNRVKYIQYLTALSCALYNEKMENKTSSSLQ